MFKATSLATDEGVLCQTFEVLRTSEVKVSFSKTEIADASTKDATYKV